MCTRVCLCACVHAACMWHTQNESTIINLIFSLCCVQVAVGPLRQSQGDGLLKVKVSHATARVRGATTGSIKYVTHLTRAHCSLSLSLH